MNSIFLIVVRQSNGKYCLLHNESGDLDDAQVFANYGEALTETQDNPFLQETAHRIVEFFELPEEMAPVKDVSTPVDPLEGWENEGGSTNE